MPSPRRSSRTDADGGIPLLGLVVELPERPRPPIWLAGLAPVAALLGCGAPAEKADAPPTAVITSPADGAVVVTGQAVSLVGAALDAEDTSPSLVARWFVDDVEVCAGSVPSADGAVACDVAAPSTSPMVVRLEVTDAAGQAAVTSVSLTVTPADAPANQAPTCAFTSPADAGWSAERERVDLAGSVADPDGAVERLTVQWSSDRSGALGASTPTSDGEVAFSTADLPPGEHVLSMVATDPAGASCTDTVAWTVGTPPTITLELPVAGEVALAGETVQFSAEVSDGDDAPDELLVTWESDLDGVFYAGHPSFSGTQAFEGTGLSPGTHTLTATVTDPLGLYAVAVTSITIDSAPTAPGVSLSPGAPTTHDALLVTVDTPSVDPDGDPLSYLYAWSVDGRASSASAAATLPASATTAGEVWTVAVSATDGFATSDLGTASVTILSSDPVVDSVTVTPTSAHVGESVRCAGTATDADGTALPVTYTWSTGAVGSTVVLTAAEDPGDVITCTVTATTDDGDVATGSAGAVVSNTSPTMTRVTVSPAVVTPGEPVTCAATATDPDGDAPTFTYAWSTGDTGATLTVDAATPAGTALVCTATATDPDGGTARGTATALVYSPPVVTDLTLSPDPLHTEDTATATATATDADGEALSLTWDWYVDGVLVQSGPDDSLSGLDWFDRGEVVEVVVTADDGTSTATLTSAPVTVTNTPPGAPEVTIDPSEPASGDSVTCSVATPSVDADGDPVTYSFEWDVDGAAYADATDGETSSTVDGSSVVESQRWTCTVTPDDGTEEGESTSVTAGRPPGASVTWVGEECDVADYRTTSVAHAYDPDGDQVYGTLGYVLYATGDAAGGHRSTMGATAPLAYSSSYYTTIASIPSWLTLTDAGQDYIAAGFGYPVVDDPREAPGASVADVEAGLALNNYVNVGDEAPVLELEFGPSPPTSVRIGILLLGSYGDMMHTVRLEQVTGGSASATATTVGDGSSTFAEFFDIEYPVEGDVFRLSLEKDHASTNPNVCYFGVTFDG